MLLAGVTGLLLTVRQPELGVALLPFVASVVPMSIGTGTQSQVVAAMIFTVVLMGIWLVRAVLSKDFTILQSAVNLPTLGLMLVWVLAYVAGRVVMPPLVVAWPTFAMAQLGGTAVLIISASALLLALNTGRDLRYVEIATWSFLAVGAVGNAAYYANALRFIWFMSINGLYDMWVVALAYGQALFNDRLPRWLRGGLLLLCFGMVYKSLIKETFWFSGWAPMLVVLLVITFLRSRRLFTVVGLVTAAVVVAKFDTLYKIVWGLTVSKGDLTRINIWQQQLQLIRQYPILGTGPAGYAVYNMNLFADSAFSMSTHSNYLDVIDETGILGAVIFLWFLLALVFVGWRAVRQWRTGFAAGFVNSAYGGLFAVLFAMGLGDWFIPFVYNQTIAGYRYTVQSWVFFGFLAAFAAMRPQTEGG